MPPVPEPREPTANWERYPLYKRVVDALYAIPSHFVSQTVIEGVAATDLQTLNSALGATIEEQVVVTLNRMRPAWDPNDEYLRFSFQRQAQVFPDVLLKADHNGQEVILGIELKGWYLLSKEREPNFRFTTTPDACAEADLIVVVPWALRNILSGSPVTYKPFVRPAKFAAEFRNHWWRNIRKSESDRTIETPPAARPYPTKSDPVSDKPVRDSGGNFGRLARTGIMDEYTKEMLAMPLAGVPAQEWIKFLQQFDQ